MNLSLLNIIFLYKLSVLTKCMRSLVSGKKVIWRYMSNIIYSVKSVLFLQVWITIDKYSDEGLSWNLTENSCRFHFHDSEVEQEHRGVVLLGSVLSRCLLFRRPNTSLEWTLFHYYFVFDALEIQTHFVTIVDFQWCWQHYEVKGSCISSLVCTFVYFNVSMQRNKNQWGRLGKQSCLSLPWQSLRW